MENKERSLILGIETLMVGGAELFVVRLANAMVVHLSVTLIVTHGSLVSIDVLNQLDKRVRLIRVSFVCEKVLRYLDRILTIFRIAFSIRDTLVVQKIREVLKTEKAVLHSHQFKVDYVFMKANRSMLSKHVLTIHGDYVNFAHTPNDSLRGILNFKKRAGLVLAKADAIVCISEHQIIFLRTWFSGAISCKPIWKIYNGLQLPDVVSLDAFGKSFRRGSFVFGMVARGIPEKGWEVAIKAVLALQDPNIQLLLVGDGPYLTSLHARYQEPQILFSGFTENPLSRIQLFDVGLLPSVYKSESLPTSIVEYLALGKPVIATDVGEVRNMLNDNFGPAGIVLPVIEDKVDVDCLSRAMKTLMFDKLFRDQCAGNARRIASKFDMGHCLRSYLELYDSSSD